MNDIHRLAQLIVSCWRMSGPIARIPTSNGLLDRAMKAVWDSGGFPEWAHERLHFADSRIGLQCVELPSILEWAQRSQLTSAPNPSYETTDVQISDRVAQRLLNELQITVAQGKELGISLRAAMEQAKAALVGIEHSRVEEY